MRKKTIFALAWCSVFLAIFLSFTTNTHSRNTASVTILLVPQLTREDVRIAHETLGLSFLKQAAIGELNIRTAVSLKDIHNTLTLGAGTRAAGSEWSRYAYGISERRAKGLAMYRQYTGELPSSLRNGTVLLPYVPLLKEVNKQRDTGAIPGLMGETLEKHGIRRTVIGNSDTPGKASRLAAVLTMDFQGITSQGWIGEETLVHTAFFPGEKKTDYAFLNNHLQRWKDEGIGLIVAELGDLVRLERYENVIAPERYAKLRQKTVEEIMDFAGILAKERNQGQRLVLLSASLPDTEIAAKRRMAPILLWEDGGSEGVVTSGTTRQLGLAANIDLAPSVLTWLGVQIPAEMKGLPLTVSHAVSHEEFWKTAEKVDHIYATRQAVLYPYIGLTMAVLLLSSLALFSWKRWDRVREKLIYFLPYLLLFVLLVPFLLLFVPLLSAVPSPVLVAIVVSIVGVGLSFILHSMPFPVCFFWIGLVGWVPLLLDGWLGGELIRRSYLGYDPVIGARYYGLGNEYMGVMLGGSLISIAMVGEMVKKHVHLLVVILLLFVVAIIVVYMAWPTGGSKAGGILVFMSVLVYGIPAFSGFVWRKWFIVFLLGIGITVACLLFMLNYQAAGAEQSHIGRAVGELLRGNWQEIGRIIERKLTMNWRLILASIWSKLFIASFIVSLLLVYYRSEKVKQIKREYPYFNAGIKTILFGSFVALLVNDSGIIAAALAMLYALVPLLYRLYAGDNVIKAQH